MMNFPRDGAESWTANMPAPSNFNQSAYQKKIDDLVGTRDGRPIIKLAWAPEEFRWWPHPCGDEPKGYMFPIFHAYTDADGTLIAAPRWVLLERIEPAQFAPTPHFWESKRYSYDSGVLWDLTGPCPSEKYVELRCHSYHDGICCSCLGDTCECGIEYAHCWGKYAEPNERLLEWIRQRVYEVRNDPDVNPDADIRYFVAPRAQQGLAGAILTAQERLEQDKQAYNDYMLNHWQRKPHSTIADGTRTTDSGLILLN